MREGGSWTVEVSLVATAHMAAIAGAGAGGCGAAELESRWPDSTAYRQACETERGRLEFLGPVMRMSETQPAWRRPPPEPGADEARWLA